MFNNCGVVKQLGVCVRAYSYSNIKNVASLLPDLYSELFSKTARLQVMLSLGYACCDIVSQR